MNWLQNYTDPAWVLLAQTTSLLIAVFVVSLRLRSRGPAATVFACKAGLIGVLALLIAPVIPMLHTRSLIHLPPSQQEASFADLQPIHRNTPNRVAEKGPTTAAVPTMRTPTIFGPTVDNFRQAAPAPSSKPIPVAQTLLEIWALGTAILLTWIVWAQVKLSLLRRRSILLREGLAFDRLENLCRQRKVAAPALRVHSKVEGPFLIGAFRPTIMMNLIAAHELDATTMDLIFEHELAHLRSKDCAWRLVERALCAVLWPQPLLWKLCAWLDQSSEEVCDQFVIANISSRRQYADCLLNLASSAWYGPVERTLGVGVVPFRSAIGRRIARIMDSSHRITTHLSRRSRLGITGITLALAVGSAFIISGSAPASHKTPHQGAPITTGDPAAIAQWNELERTYANLDSFSTTIKTDEDGERKVLQMLYKRPDRTVVKVMSDRVMMVSQVIFVDDSSVTTTWPSNPKVYRTERSSEGSVAHGVKRKWQPSLFGMWGRAMLHPNCAYLLLTGTPDFAVSGNHNLSFGPDSVVDGEPVTTLVVESINLGGMRHPATTTFSISKTDHLIRRVQRVTQYYIGQDRSQTHTQTIVETYENVRSNPPIDDRDVTFHAPAGAIAASPLGGDQTPPADVQALLDKVTEAYKSAQTISFVARASGGTGATLTVALKKPNFLRMSLNLDKYPNQGVHSLSDGVNQYTWEGENATRYLQVPATPQLIGGFGEFGIAINSFDVMLDSVAWSFGSPPYRLIQGDMKLGPSTTVNGVPVDTVIATQPLLGPAMMPLEDSFVRKTYSFGKRDHLLYEVQTHDHSVQNGKTWDRQLNESVEKLEVNKPIADDFAFHPGAMTRATTLRDTAPRYNNGTGIEIGDRFTDFAANDMQGKPFSLEQYRGKVLLIHAWTQGVTNYKWDMPRIEALYRKYRKLGFEAVGIACDYAEDRPWIDKYLAANGIQSRQLFDGLHLDQGFKKKLKLHSFPFSYLIGRDGKVFAKNPWVPDIEPQIKSALEAEN